MSVRGYGRVVGNPETPETGLESRSRLLARNNFLLLVEITSPPVITIEAALAASFASPEVNDSRMYDNRRHGKSQGHARLIDGAHVWCYVSRRTLEAFVFGG